ncbi:TM2 domain-containing protein [Tenacibaculum sp. S7007]|uniref:TM2 domain-containing protein n=1 Tax=Tenacibaculum pelagium TaxID=2759527 RepID=A0A839APU3_9FLAO|nr:TM2 domain-containing protein [Tenacibaculum pelagium]MBA6157102.1 TM2 domain-containing protein [Tenacibaculum pelagium]
MNVIDENGNPVPNQESKRVLAGVLAILLGGFGVHKFILGYTKEGIVTLVLTIVLSIITCGIFSGVMWLVSLIEGIIYLTKSDEEFVYTYQTNQRGWF